MARREARWIDASPRRRDRDQLGLEVGQRRSPRSAGIRDGRSPGMTTRPNRRVTVNAISTASLTAEPPSYRLALETSMPVNWVISVWYSKVACRVPWLASGW